MHAGRENNSLAVCRLTVDGFVTHSKRNMIHDNDKKKKN